jgi:hypothetical protein
MNKLLFSILCTFTICSCANSTSQSEEILIKTLEKNNTILEQVSTNYQITIKKSYELDKGKIKKYYDAVLTFDTVTNRTLAAVQQYSNIAPKGLKISNEALTDSLSNFSRKLLMVKKISEYYLPIIPDFEPILRNQGYSKKLQAMLLKNEILTSREQFALYTKNLISATYDGFNNLFPVVVANNDRLKLGENFHGEVFLTFFNRQPYDIVFNDCRLNGKPVKLAIESYSDNGRLDIHYRPTQKGRYSLRGYLVGQDYYNHMLPFKKDFIVE